MKKAILLAAYGTSNPKGKEGLRSFELACRARFPAWPVRWAFTSPILRQRMARERQKSDSVRKALMRLGFEKFSAVAIQPLQTIPGREHEEVCQSVADAMRATGMRCSVGAPLLNSHSDIERAARAIVSHLPKERAPEEDVALMGHGARHPAAALYATLAEALAGLDAHVHTGAMSGPATLEDILPRLASPVVWLMPMLSVVGQHALRDMAGPSPQSWKSKIESMGHECRPVLRGLAEYPSLAEIWLDHLQTATQDVGMN